MHRPRQRVSDVRRKQDKVIVKATPTLLNNVEDIVQVNKLELTVITTSLCYLHF